MGGWALGLAVSARRPCGGWFDPFLDFWVRSGGWFALVWLAARSARLPPMGADFLVLSGAGLLATCIYAGLWLHFPWGDLSLLHDDAFHVAPLTSVYSLHEGYYNLP